MTKTKKIFVFLDFDKTLTENDSLTDMIEMVKTRVPDWTMPPDLVKLYTKETYVPDFMNGLTTVLHDNGATPEDLRLAARSMRPVPGIRDLVVNLSNANVNVVVISDGNSIYIEEFLASQKIRGCVDKIITNPTHFAKSGQMIYQPYHIQEHCSLNTRNLCKGLAMKEYIQDAQADQDCPLIIYIGDGQNDFCPIKSLTSTDFAFIRKDHSLHKLLTSGDIDSTEIAAQISFWTTGNDIDKVLKSTGILI